MALPATDDFTDTNGVQITAHGTAWELTNALLDFDIQSNNFAADYSSAYYAAAYWNADSFYDNQYSKIVIAAIQTSTWNQVGVTVRCSTTAHTFYYWGGGGDESAVFKKINTTQTQIGSTSGGLAVNDVIRLEITANRLTPLKNGSSTGTPGNLTDSSIMSGHAGIGGFVWTSGSRTTTRGDNWEGGHFEALPKFDNFNGSSGEQRISVYDTNWKENNGSQWTIVVATGDVKQSSSQNSENACHWEGNAFNNNQYAQAKISSVASMNGQGVAVRVASGTTGTYYCFYCDNADHYLGKNNSGTWSQLANTDTTNGAAGEIIRLEVSGTSLSPKINGSLWGQGTITDESIGSGYAGFSGWGTASDARVDDFEGGNLGGGATEETATLAKYAGISGSTQTNENGVSILVKYDGISGTTQTNENDASTLAKYDGLSVLESIVGGGIEESVSLGIILRVTERLPQSIDEDVVLSAFYSIEINDQVVIEDTTLLLKQLGQENDTLVNVIDFVNLSKNKGFSSGSQSNENDLINLGRIDTIGQVDQTNESDSISLGFINTFTPLSQTIENDAIVLADFIDITVLEETQGFINETVILARLAGIEVLQEGASHVSEEVSIARSNQITISEQTQVGSNISLSKIIALGISEQYKVSENVTTDKFIGITTDAYMPVAENVNLAKFIGLNTNSQCQVGDNVNINKFVGISISEYNLIPESVTLAKANEILNNTQIRVNDDILLNRLVDISNITECQVGDYFTLTKFVRITVVEETQGQYSENVILDRFVSLSILQEGISHVSEEVSIARSNLVTISEQTRIYNSLIFGRLNGITPVAQSKFYNSLIFSKIDGLSASSQDIINENITANKFNGLAINSQIIIPELIDLSQLYGLAILDSRYLLEGIALQYSKGLSLMDSPTIFESIELEKINIITMMTLLIGYNVISIGQVKSIIAEPPSLYVYNDGNHSAGVLFRDKRAEVIFRDKRASVSWRDKRSSK